MHKVNIWSAICYRCLSGNYDIGIHGIFGELVNDICGQHATQNRYKARTLDSSRAAIFEDEKPQYQVQKRENCVFMVESIRTMGFLVQFGVIKPDPQKLDMLKKMPEPQTRQQLKAYLGLLQFYRDMLPHLAHTAYQLYAAT